MSTDIKPGQVWAWRGGCGSRSAPGVTFKIVEASANAPHVAYQYQPREGYDSERVYTAPAEDILNAAALLVETVDASDMTHDEIEDVAGKENADFLAPTPAPLDPSKVKAGDTVTLRVTPVEKGKKPFTVEGEVYGTPGALMVGGLWVMNDKIATLTAHQPAPEPEPEWEPGDMAAVTARGWVNGWSVRTAANDGWASHSDSDDVRSDAEVESVRPLAVIDPADVDVDALNEAALSAYHLDSSVMTADGVRAAVGAVLAKLGIEAP